jgi:EAL domain-containing protein (putative c-di-GMP-specific phosphodiesterase class I)
MLPTLPARCDEMQGYLFSKPVPESELVALLPPTS